MRPNSPGWEEGLSSFVDRHLLLRPCLPRFRQGTEETLFRVDEGFFLVVSVFSVIFDLLAPRRRSSGVAAKKLTSTRQWTTIVVSWMFVVVCVEERETRGALTKLQRAWSLKFCRCLAWMFARTMQAGIRRSCAPLARHSSSARRQLDRRLDFRADEHRSRLGLARLSWRGLLTLSEMGGGKER